MCANVAIIQLKDSLVWASGILCAAFGDNLRPKGGYRTRIKDYFNRFYRFILCFSPVRDTNRGQRVSPPGKTGDCSAAR